jgi:hypothetical protein
LGHFYFAEVDNRHYPNSDGQSVHFPAYSNRGPPAVQLLFVTMASIASVSTDAEAFAVGNVLARATLFECAAIE